MTQLDTQTAKETWKDIVKTSLGQAEFIEALKNKETDAINYAMTAWEPSIKEIFEDHVKPACEKVGVDSDSQYEDFYQDALEKLLTSRQIKSIDDLLPGLRRK